MTSAKQIACIGALLVPSLSLARTITLAPGQGLTQALVRAGCNLDQLSHVMAVNNISYERLRKLTTRDQITVPDGCSAQPDRQTSEMSRLYIRMDMLEHRRSRLASQIGGLQRRIRSLEQTAKTQTDRINSLQDLLDRKISDYNTVLSQRDLYYRQYNELQPLLKRPRIPWWWWTIGVLVLIGIAAAAFFAARYNRPAFPVYYRARVPGRKGTVRFYVTQITRSADGIWDIRCQCPLCTENNLKPSGIRRHLERVHFTMSPRVDEEPVTAGPGRPGPSDDTVRVPRDAT